MHETSRIAVVAGHGDGNCRDARNRLVKFMNQAVEHWSELSWLQSRRYVAKDWVGDIWLLKNCCSKQALAWPTSNFVLSCAQQWAVADDVHSLHGAAVQQVSQISLEQCIAFYDGFHAGLLSSAAYAIER